MQIQSPGQEQEVAPPGEAADCDLVIALGGDGTALAALHVAAPVGRPVLGVACGSLGALTATTAEELDEALGRVAAGDWQPRRLPALVGERDGEELHAINDVVFVRDGAGQVMVDIEVEGERYVRFAGDGVVAATPLGSTAYTLASGGPMLAPGHAPASCSRRSRRTAASARRSSSPRGSRSSCGWTPATAARASSSTAGSHAKVPAHEPFELTLRCKDEFATLVSLGDEESMMAGLRRRRILLDSPRVLARDDREAAGAARE